MNKNYENTDSVERWEAIQKEVQQLIESAERIGKLALSSEVDEPHEAWWKKILSDIGLTIAIKNYFGGNNRELFKFLDTTGMLCDIEEHLVSDAPEDFDGADWGFEYDTEEEDEELLKMGFSEEGEESPNVVTFRKDSDER